MSEITPAAELHRRCIEQLGADLGGLHYALFNELAWLHIKWEQYTILFGSTESRVEILNRAAPLFFRVLQDSLWDDALLSIARLMDPPESRGKPNLSFRRYTKLVTTPELRDEVDRLTALAVDSSSFAIEWRKQHIAHRDLRRALKDPVDPLPTASRAAVKHAIASMVAIYNAVQAHHFDSTTYFGLGGEPGDATLLLRRLRDGLQAEQKRVARIQAGKPDPDDYLEDAV